MKDTASLNLPKDLVNPIIENHIRLAIQEALGGTDEILTKVIDTILNSKVDAEGKVSNYSHHNKYSWLEAVVSKKIKESVEVILQEEIGKVSSTIRDALVKHIRTKEGADKVARALLDGMNKTFEKSWTSRIDVHIDPLTNNEDY